LTAAYAPPADPRAEVSESSVAVHGDAFESGYRSRSLLARALSGLLLVDALWLGLNFGVCALAVFAPSTTAQLDALDGGSLQGWAKVHPVFHWTRVVLFAWFLVGSNKNARAFVRAEEPRKRVQAPLLFHFSSASMVWWFAVPIFNLFKPYSALRAVWNASQPISDRAQNRPASVTWHWWLAYLLAFFFTFQRVVLLMIMRWSEPNLTLVLHNLRSSPELLALQSLSDSAAAVLAWRMVLALHERQRLRAVELWPTNSQR
jgi:hypothetical protein